MSPRRVWVAIAADAAAWACVQLVSGYVAHRLPDRVLDREGWLLRERAWERGGCFYVEVARIRRWKGLLPEAGAFFAGGVSKRNLHGRGGDDLARLARETRRAELGHWLMMAPTPLFVALNRPLLAPFMAGYAVSVNLPCIAAQRYNRIRLRRARERLQRRPTAVAVTGRLSDARTTGAAGPVIRPPT